MNFITLCVGLSFLVLSVLKYIGYAPKINAEVLLCFAAATFLFALGSVFNDFAARRKETSLSVKNHSGDTFSAVAKVFSFMGIFVAVCLPLVLTRFFTVFGRFKLDDDLIVLINLTLVLLSISIKSRITAKIPNAKPPMKSAETPASPAIELAAATADPVDAVPGRPTKKQPGKKPVEPGE